ncbi:MAG: hypothetical protein Q7R41_18285 [Phycisphaerales bacterium]|nr:hypothetical protein [Phycisphaerales bacterium]
MRPGANESRKKLGKAMFIDAMAKHLQAVQMNDRDMFVVKVGPLFVSGCSDIHAFQIKGDVIADALDHIPCRTAQ